MRSCQIDRSTMRSKPTKVLLFGTHPLQFNGYSKVVYELVQQFAKFSDVELRVYGFQNFYINAKHRSDLPGNVVVYDAFANEPAEKKTAGFGINEIPEYVKEFAPDVCVVYNDLLIITSCVQKIKEAGVPTKIVAYVDQVYLCQKREYLDALNQHVDFAIAFTPYWETILKDQGVNVPTDFLQHGFNPRAHYTVPKNLARMYFGLRQDDFLILNLNRNQPRKRWDICLKAFAEVVSRLPDAPIKMVIATGLTGGWNLIEIFERELKKRNLTLQDGMKHIVILDNPQKITDEETNILYNAADIGINTCDGEGFGLCNFEQAGLGIPQVVSNVGGFIDFFNEDNAIVVEPILAYYVDSTRDAVCGEAMMCDYNDFADGIVEYYNDAEKRQKHGQAAREKILKDYKWSDIAEKLRGIIYRVTPELDRKEEQQPAAPPSAVIADEEDINIKDLQSIIQPAPAVDPVVELKRLRHELNKILTSLGQDSA